ncbi:hypothetical protein F4V43_01980 [Paenibacillus spiritus]|uniref:Uncharacterized protein n=1 Tax=Paenibacillus spiritus TaxID=2496557 RepID=A0A5J5GHU9_9BACL|nr:hypothetical protein [Paenibacillus spiritus]KAA9007278.1 hypothetical protein F4V43_01980 [Paenibacillus spiritus]
MRMPVDAELELIKWHVIYPFLLDVLQDNMDITFNSNMRFRELFVCHMEMLMDKVSQEQVIVRKHLRTAGIKVFDAEWNKTEIRVGYLCR